MLNLRAAFQSDYWTEYCESYTRRNKPTKATLQWLHNYQPALPVALVTTDQYVIRTLMVVLASAGVVSSVVYRLIRRHDQ